MKRLLVVHNGIDPPHSARGLQRVEQRAAHEELHAQIVDALGVLQAHVGKWRCVLRLPYYESTELHRGLPQVQAM